MIILFSVILALLNYVLRKTFFDQIDEDVDYPPHYSRYDIHTSHAVGLADSKILFTFGMVNFTLFWLEEDVWHENMVEVSNRGLIELDGQLLTLKNYKTERL